MKLVELLAHELKAWPDGAEFYCQDYNRKAYPYEMTPKRHEHREVLWGSDGQLSGIAAVVLSGIASDHDTAIVTRADWAAERARIAKPAKKADKEGWIRHRGGKCPVEVGTLIDIRCRDGSIREGVPCGKECTRTSSMFWSHDGDGAEVMAYRLHKPAEQVDAEKVMRDCVEKCASTESASQLLYDQIAQGPLQWRDRITEIDATTQALTAGRAELVQKLASEGFALIGLAVEHEAQQPDPGRWMIGDSIECISSNYSFITVGTVYVITGFYRNMVQFLDDDETEMEYGLENFKFHSRPSA